MKKRIKLGSIQISNWTPKSKKMFHDFYYDKNDEFYDKSFEREIKKCAPDEVILPANSEFTLEITYPVKNPYRIKIKVGAEGMTRIRLVDIICKSYRKMYKEEDSAHKVGLIPGMLNRATSSGPYGIWGHVIEDLCLIECEVKENKMI